MPSKRCLTYFHRVHGPRERYLKADYLYGTMGAPNALLNLRDPHEHKIRRAIVNPVYSQKSIDGLASMVQDKLEQLINIMRRRNLEGKPTDIQKLYRCMTV